MRKVFTAIVIVLMVVAVTAPAFAAPKGDPTKLTRGAKNTVLGWTEIPKGIVETSKKDNVLVGATVGTIKGILNAFARTASGLVDLVTFPIGDAKDPALKPTMTGTSEEANAPTSAAGSKVSSKAAKAKPANIK